MRFEVWYKDYLKEQVADKGYDVVAVNDNAFKVNTLMDKSDKTVLMLVQGGNVTKSTIAGYDLNTMPVIVNFLVPLNLKNDFMSNLCDLADSYNAMLMNVDIDKKRILYRGIYNTPYVLGETTEIRHGGGTMKVCTVQWIISLNYGVDAYVTTPTLYLTLNGTKYDVTRLMRFEFSYNPAYDNYQSFGSDIQQAKKLSEIRSYVLQIAMKDYFGNSSTTADPFQKLLFRILTAQENIDGDITLSWFQYDIPIKRFSLSGGIENNTGSYLITLEV